MSITYIRKTYGVPARRGGRVRFTGERDRVLVGTIVSSRGGYLRIRMDGYKKADVYHPTWELEYLDTEKAKP